MEEKELSLEGELSSIPETQRHLTLIEYPGFVKNVDAAIETLGGVRQLSTAIQQPESLLQLHFRPSDPFCHPIFSDRRRTSNLLVKMSRKKRKAEEPGMADFQYLAPSDGGKTKQDLKKQLLKGGDLSTIYDEQEGLHLPPPIFSKIDQPLPYYYQDNIHTAVSARDGGSRQSKDRRDIIQYVSTFTEPVPSEPTASCLEYVGKFPQLEEGVRQLYKDRPIWTLLALYSNMTLTKVDKFNLRYVLPMVGYYCVSGPFGRSWIRFGFDPTTTRDSVPLQVIDLRVNPSQTVGGGKTPVAGVVGKPRRRRRAEGGNIDPTKLAGGVEPEVQDEEVDERQYTFSCPPSRQQTRYQMCDLEDVTIQKFIQNHTREECNPKTGWYSKHALDHVRIMMKLKLERMLKGNYDHLEEEILEDAEEKVMRTERMSDRMKLSSSKRPKKVKSKEKSSDVSADPSTTGLPPASESNHGIESEGDDEEADDADEDEEMAEMLEQRAEADLFALNDNDDEPFQLLDEDEDD